MKFVMNFFNPLFSVKMLTYLRDIDEEEFYSSSSDSETESQDQSMEWKQESSSE